MSFFILLVDFGWFGRSGVQVAMRYEPFFGWLVGWLVGWIVWNSSLSWLINNKVRSALARQMIMNGTFKGHLAYDVNGPLFLFLFHFSGFRPRHYPLILALREVEDARPGLGGKS